MNDLTIGILSHQDRKTLRNTLDSYKRSGLLTYPEQIFIFFNAVDSEDLKVAFEYGIKCYGAEENLGIAGAYEQMLKYVKQSNFLFLEDDWHIRYEEFQNVIPQLDMGLRLLEEHTADVVRFRSRKNPGEPLWTRQFQGNELSRPEHLLDCIHWTENPEKFDQIKEIHPGWYRASSKNANWTNNPHMVRTEWVKNELLPHMRGDIELNIANWWPTTDYKVMQGEGMFIHNRAVKLRGEVDIAVFGKDHFSDTLKREKDFFEANILDYIRDNYPEQKTIIDAGASFGNHVLYFANYLKFESIHAFEPLPETFRLLEINATLPKVHLYNNALSHKKETLEMNVNRGNTGASRIHQHGEVKVEALAIDDLNLKDVTFFKIDVEDSEEFVIKGARKTIDKYHPMILLEDYRHRPWDKILPGYVLEKAWDRQHTFLYRWSDKPYLIELYTRTPGCANYERTFHNVKDSVEHLPIVLRTYRGHLHRWDHMPMTLGDRMCIFTDSADVIFQKPIPSLDNSKIYVSNEGVCFQNNGVWRGLIRRYPQFECLLPEIIYNVGSFACSGTKMKEWVEYLWSVRGKCRQNSNEQMWFNLWLRLPENKSLITEHSDLFTSLYANIKVGITTIKDGKFVNKEGIPFSIVHANGGTKNDYKLIIENAT